LLEVSRLIRVVNKWCPILRGEGLVYWGVSRIFDMGRGVVTIICFSKKIGTLLTPLNTPIWCNRPFKYFLFENFITGGKWVRNTARNFSRRPLEGVQFFSYTFPSRCGVQTPSDSSYHTPEMEVLKIPFFDRRHLWLTPFLILYNGIISIKLSILIEV